MKMSDRDEFESELTADLKWMETTTSRDYPSLQTSRLEDMLDRTRDYGKRKIEQLFDSELEEKDFYIELDRLGMYVLDYWSDRFGRELKQLEKEQ